MGDTCWAGLGAVSEKLKEILEAFIKKHGFEDIDIKYEAVKIR